MKSGLRVTAYCLLLQSLLQCVLGCAEWVFRSCCCGLVALPEVFALCHSCSVQNALHLFRFAAFHDHGPNRCSTEPKYTSGVPPRMRCVLFARRQASSSKTSLGASSEGPEASGSSVRVVRAHHSSDLILSMIVVVGSALHTSEPSPTARLHTTSWKRGAALCSPQSGLFSFQTIALRAKYSGGIATTISCASFTEVRTKTPH